MRLIPRKVAWLTALTKMVGVWQWIKSQIYIIWESIRNNGTQNNVTVIELKFLIEWSHDLSRDWTQNF